MLFHQHRVKNTKGVLYAKDGPVAPGSGEDHQPAESTLGGHEVRALSGVWCLTCLWRGWPFVGTSRFDELSCAILRGIFTLAFPKALIRLLVFLWDKGCLLLLHRTLSRLITLPSLQFAIWYLCLVQSVHLNPLVGRTTGACWHILRRVTMVFWVHPMLKGSQMPIHTYKNSLICDCLFIRGGLERNHETSALNLSAASSLNLRRTWKFNLKSQRCFRGNPNAI